MIYHAMLQHIKQEVIMISCHLTTHLTYEECCHVILQCIYHMKNAVMSCHLTTQLTYKEGSRVMAPYNAFTI